MAVEDGTGTGPGIDPRGLPMGAAKIPSNAPEMVKNLKRWFDSAGPTIVMASLLMRFMGKALDGIGAVLFDLAQLLVAMKLDQSVDKLAAGVDNWRKPAPPAPTPPPDPTSADTGNAGPPPTGGYRGGR